MPLYTVRDDNDQRKQILMEVDELLSYTERTSGGDRIYSGTEFPEAHGTVVFMLSGAMTGHGAETKPPPATRRLGDHFTSPSFGRKAWV